MNRSRCAEQAPPASAPPGPPGVGHRDYCGTRRASFTHPHQDSLALIPRLSILRLPQSRGGVASMAGASWRRGLHGGRMHPDYLRWLHCPGTTAVGLLGVPRRVLLRAGEPSCLSCFRLARAVSARAEATGRCCAGPLYEMASRRVRPVRPVCPVRPVTVRLRRRLGPLGPLGLLGPLEPLGVGCVHASDYSDNSDYSDHCVNI